MDDERMDDRDDFDAAAGPNRQPRTLLMLPGVKPSTLAMLAKLIGIWGHAVPMHGYLLLVLPPAVDGEPIAQRLSSGFKKRSDVVLLQLADGYLSAQRWSDGELIEKPPAGVVAQSLPDDVTLLLSGHRDPAQMPGAVQIGGDIDRAARPGFFGRLFGR